MARGRPKRSHEPVDLGGVEVPAGVIETVNRIVRTSRQTLRDTGREPTPEELAEALEVPLEKIRNVLRIAKA